MSSVGCIGSYIFIHFTDAWLSLNQLDPMGLKVLGLQLEQGNQSQARPAGETGQFLPSSKMTAGQGALKISPDEEEYFDKISKALGLRLNYLNLSLWSAWSATSSKTLHQAYQAYQAALELNRIQTSAR